MAQTDGERGRTRRRLWAGGLAAGAAVVAVLAATAVWASGDDESDRGAGDESAASAGTGWAELAEPDGLRALDLDDGPAWDGSTGPAIARGETVVLDEAMVVHEVGEGHVVVDDSTGEERWRLTDGGPVPGLDGATVRPRLSDQFDVDMRRSPLPITGSGPPALVTEYERTRCDAGCPIGPTTVEVGLAALDVDGGALRWSVAIPARRAGDDPPMLADVTAGAGLVVALVEEHDDAANPRSRTIAYDAADGSRLWEVGDVEPLQVTGGAVVAGARSGTEAGALEIVGLDPATGRQLWAFGGPDSADTLGAVAGEVAIVHTTDLERGGAQAVAIDLATGDELAAFENPDGRCTTDGETLVACVVDTDPAADAARRGERLATLRLEDGATALAAEDVGSETGIDSVVRGRIVLTDGDEVRSVDRSGTVVDEHLPGPVLATDGSHAVFGCVDQPDCTGYEVHNLGPPQP